MSINQTINVNSYFFTTGRELRTYPREIEFDNTRYTFNDGMQYVVGKGPESIKLFDMTDGSTTFRLRQENDNWTLVSKSV